MSLKKWKKLSERVFHDNGFWQYKIDEFEIEESQRGEYHYVSTYGSTMVIPVTPQNKIILVKQFRYLNQRESLEFPCGSISKGLSAEENAIKELREETGYTSRSLVFSGEFSPYTGASNEMCSVFLGLNLELSPLPVDSTEEFEVLEFSFEEIEQMIAENKIWDGLSLSAWILSKEKIKLRMGIL
jgi:ADP-ribose pyrophosphatase